ncbi:MAG: TraB/GumN family protein, partial [Deefgea sp.]
MRSFTRWWSLLWGMLFWLSSSAYALCVPASIAPTAAEIQQLQESASDHGFLWKISKEGRTSWLYGSIHVNRLSAAYPGPKIRQALQQSQIIALELDPKDMATQTKLAQLGSQGAGQVPAALKSRLKAQLDKVCVPESAVQVIHPTLLLAHLSALNLRKVGFESTYGTENMLVANQTDKKIVALETVESQMLALLGDGKVSP